MKLTSTQIKLAEQLLLSVSRRENVIEYNEIANRINPPIFWRQVGREIGEVSKQCHELGLPLLSAKVISKGQGKAGVGFYNLMKELGIDTHGKSEKELFTSELKKIRECTEWYKLADFLHINMDLPRPNEIETKALEPTIKILPMSSKEEFPGMSIESVQNNYFLRELKNDHKGEYYFRKAGMNAANGSLILFQFDNMIIASADLLRIKKFNKPVENEYYGAYEFDVNSIRIFQPITYREINIIDNSIVSFSQAKQEINPALRQEIEKLIKRKQAPLFAEELPQIEGNKLKEGAKKQVLVNSYERNYKARQVCIEHYGCICSVCGFDFGEFYGVEFEGKIHVHHLKALSEISEEYEVNPINDLRPVCPNCHLALHSKIGDKPYNIKDLQAKIRNKKKTKSF